MRWGKKKQQDTEQVAQAATVQAQTKRERAAMPPPPPKKAEEPMPEFDPDTISMSPQEAQLLLDGLAENPDVKAYIASKRGERLFMLGERLQLAIKDSQSQDGSRQA